MAKLVLVILQLVALALGDNSVAKSSISPTEKVIEMLETLLGEVETDSVQEKSEFAKFSKFCTDNTDDKTEAIKEGKAKIESENATVLKRTADFEKAQTDITEAKAKKEELEKAKEDNQRQFDEDKATFEATDADLSSAITGLEEAKAKLEASNSAEVAGFIQFDFLDRTIKLAEAMGFLESPRRKELSAFLQQKADPWVEGEGAAYNKKEYEFQSGGIVQTLKDLHTEFSDELTKVTSEFNATKRNYEDVKADTTTAIGTKEGEITASEQRAATAKQDADNAEEEMLEAIKTLKADKTYLSELTANCAARTSDFNQREKNREGEVKALGEAIKVMKDTVADLDKSVNGAFLQGPAYSAEPASFLQEESVSEQKTTAHAASTELSAQAARKSRLEKALTKKAMSMVAQSGAALNSFRLKGLAVRMTQAPAAADNANGNTLGFVKNLVNDLINKLIQEAEAESTQKGFCDSEMDKAEYQRDRRKREAMKLSANLKALDTKHTELVEEIAVLTADISKLNKDLSNATTLRTTDSTANLKTIKECKEAFVATKSAIKTLTDFYAKANRAAARHDKKAEDVKAQEEIRDNSITEGSYAGKQQQSLGIVTLLEVVRDDFHETEIQTSEEEEDATKEFTKFKLASMEDISGKETKKELCEEDLKTTKNDLSSKKSELTRTVGLLDDALSTLEDLKPQCVDNVMSYEERKAKRDAEIESLTTAMCTLDPEGKEAACKK